jgi:hypothetical protein
LVTLGSVLIVTLPAALAAGAGHLRRHLKAEEASLKLFWSDFRAALPGGLAVGLGLVLASAATAFSLLLAAADGSVAGQIMRVLAGLVLLALATGTALAATDWTPSRGWARALKRLRPRFEQNPKAAAYTAGAVLAAALMTWMLYLLAVPALGLILFAAVAITETTRR